MLSLEAKFLLQVFCGFFSTMYIVQLTYKQLEQFSVKRLPTSLPLSPLFTPQKTAKKKKQLLKNCSTLILQPRENKTWLNRNIK